MTGAKSNKYVSNRFIQKFLNNLKTYNEKYISIEDIKHIFHSIKKQRLFLKTLNYK